MQFRQRFKRCARLQPRGDDRIKKGHVVIPGLQAFIAVINHDGSWQRGTPRNADPQSPAGGASSSVNDMARWLSLLLAFGTLTGCAGQIGIIGGEDGPTAIITSDSASAVSVTEDGQYDSKDEVSAYLTEYGHLPSNYITKKQAQALGWQGGSLEPYAPGCSIGGDRFGNYEGLLPEADGRTYTECDIDTLGADSRGAKRIVFSNDGLIYYTEDHYKSFELLYGEE